MLIYDTNEDSCAENTFRGRERRKNIFTCASNINVKGQLIRVWRLTPPPQVAGMNEVHRHPCRQNTHTHRIIKSKSENITRNN